LPRTEFRYVRAGTTHIVLANAYEAMERLATGLGVSLDNLRISVTSIETNEGPGLRLIARHETENDSGAPKGDAEEDARGDEPPA
jgi:hypothetical protein